MSFQEELVRKCGEYTNFTYHIPYNLGSKNTPSQIKNAVYNWIGSSSKTKSEVETWMKEHKDKTGIDCSGLVYYCLNEASGGKVKSYFQQKLNISSLTYAFGISADNLTNTSYGSKKTKAKDITPGCTIRFDNGGHVLVVHTVKKENGVVKKIYYSHSNSSKGPHSGIITIGDETKDLNASAQIWSDSAYTDAQAKKYYNHTIKLNCL